MRAIRYAAALIKSEAYFESEEGQREFAEWKERQANTDTAKYADN
jgi:hypothetical protein